MTRAMWKGRLVIGPREVPVKFFSAVEDRGIHFRLLHAADQQPVNQELVDLQTGEPVPRSAIKKAFEVEPHVLVKLREEELEKAQPEPSRDVELLRFVEPSRVDHRWYERPYYLGPDGDDDAYAALVAALRKSKREGIARWAMRKHGYVGVLRESEGHLVIISLRHREEVVPAADLPKLATLKEITPKERDLARQLIAALQAPFDITRFRDDYRDRVHELVANKVGGKVIQLPKRTKKPASDSALADALKRSVGAAKQRKSA